MSLNLQFGSGGGQSSRGTLALMDSISSVERVAQSKSSLLRDFPSTTASSIGTITNLAGGDQTASQYFNLLRDNYQAQQAKLQAIRETITEDFKDPFPQGSFRYNKAKISCEITGKEYQKFHDDEEQPQQNLGSQLKLS